MRRPFCYWHSNTDVDENIHFGQSYDFGFYNYNGRLERFFNVVEFFSKRNTLLVASQIFTALAL
jgi:hypothetical protein